MKGAAGERARRRRLLYAVCILLGVGALLVGYLLTVRAAGQGIPCLIRRAIGLLCGSCGLTRALDALLRGEMAAAFGYNPLWPLYIAWGGWVLVGGAAHYVRRGVWRLLPRPLWLHGAMAALVVIFGIIRNFL